MSPSSTFSPPSPHSTSLIHTIGPYIPLSDSDSSSSSSPTPPPTRGGRFEGFPLLGAHQEGLSSLRSTQQSQSSARTIYNVQGSNKSQFHSRSSSNAPHQHRGPSPDILAVHREKAFKQSPPLASRPLIAESPHFLPFVPSEGSRSLRHIQLAEPIAESDRSLESDGNARKELQQAQIWEDCSSCTSCTSSAISEGSLQGIRSSAKRDRHEKSHKARHTRAPIVIVPKQETQIDSNHRHQSPPFAKDHLRVPTPPWMADSDSNQDAENPYYGSFSSSSYQQSSTSLPLPPYTPRRTPSRSSQASSKGKRRAGEDDDEDEEEEEGDEGEKKKRKIQKKAAMACHFCRKRKLRCDGNRPTCHTCEKKGVECQWDPAPRRRGPGKKNRNAMSHATASSAEPSQPTASTSTLAGGSSSSSRENSTPFTSSSRRQQQNPVPLPNPFALPQPHQHPPVEEVAEEGPVPHGYYNPRSRQALQRPQPQYPPEQHQGQRILDINPAPSPVPSQGSVTLPSLHSLGLLDTPERATRPVRPSPYVMPDAMMQGPPPGPPPPSYEQYRSPQHTLPAIPNFDDDDDDRPPRLVQANFEQIENLRRSQASSSRRGRSTGRPPLARGGGSSRGRGRGGRPGDDDHDEGTGSILGASGYRTGLPPKGT